MIASILLDQTHRFHICKNDIQFVLVHVHLRRAIMKKKILISLLGTELDRTYFKKLHNSVDGEVLNCKSEINNWYDLEDGFIYLRGPESGTNSPIYCLKRGREANLCLRALYWIFISHPPQRLSSNLIQVYGSRRCLHTRIRSIVATSVAIFTPIFIRHFERFCKRKPCVQDKRETFAIHTPLGLSIHFQRAKSTVNFLFVLI